MQKPSSTPAPLTAACSVVIATAHHMMAISDDQSTDLFGVAFNVSERTRSIKNDMM